MTTEKVHLELNDGVAGFQQSADGSLEVLTSSGKSHPADIVILAGPANRQSRIAADVIAGRDSRYRGTQGTSICRIFEGAIAQTGVSKKVLMQLGDQDFEKIYLYPNSHAGYLSGRQDAGHQNPVPELRRASARGADTGRRGSKRGRSKRGRS